MTNIKSAIIALTFTFLLCLQGITQAQEQLLRIHGSNTIGAKLIPALVENWLASRGYENISVKHTDTEEKLVTAKNTGGDVIQVQIHSHGSGTAFVDLADNNTDLGMSSRPIKEKELKKLERLGDLKLPKYEFILALDGLAVIVHPDNPLGKLDKSTLRDIFSGKIRNWRKLNGNPGQIHVYARDDKSGTYDTFKSLVLSKKTALIDNAKRFESNSKLADEVAKDTQGIGFVGLAYVRLAKQIAIADQGANPMMPTVFNVATEDYNLSRRLYLYLPGSHHKPLAREFAAYAVSPQAQDLVDKTGFVSQNIFSSNHANPGLAPPEYRELTDQAQRLSLNIRFRPGYSKLDNKAVRDVKRLITFLSRPEHRNSQLMLFGFADSKESVPYASLSLSIDRADAVADYLIAAGLNPVRVRGYGQALPVAGNYNHRGRHINRRVEIWIKDNP